MNINNMWLSLIAGIASEPDYIVTPKSFSAVRSGGKTYEKDGNLITIDMRCPIVSVIERNLNYKFMLAEAIWILTGDSGLAGIEPYCKIMANYSDDGITLYGAYGPKVMSQYEHVLKTLRKDPDSRQAVISIWRENPPDTKDTPCTVSVQFMIRGGQLHCYVVMRSSDAWTGLPYDIFNFSMIAYSLAIDLGVPLGYMKHYAVSRHMYEKDVLKYRELLKEPGFDTNFKYTPTDNFIFNNSEELLHHLVCLRDNEETVSLTFSELRKRIYGLKNAQ